MAIVIHNLQQMNVTEEQRVALVEADLIYDPYWETADGEDRPVQYDFGVDDERPGPREVYLLCDEGMTLDDIEARLDAPEVSPQGSSPSLCAR